MCSLIYGGCTTISIFIISNYLIIRKLSIVIPVRLVKNRGCQKMAIVNISIFLQRGEIARIVSRGWQLIGMLDMRITL